MDKIVGFLISRNTKTVSFDIFGVGLNNLALQCGQFTILFWGVGDLRKCVTDGRYSMSFPLNGSLLDRNVLISCNDAEIVIENDWLGSIPVFYNEFESIVSTISNYCLVSRKDVHSEGLLNFCRFGYSVFEQTPFTGVKFMRHCSRLILNHTGIKVEYGEDPVTGKMLEVDTSPDTAIETTKSYVNAVNQKIDSNVLMPLSGGFDSRFILSLIENRRRFNCFTYGVSTEQSASYEVVYAKAVSSIMGVPWHQIELTHYQDFIEEWFNVYGISTHTHGMYQIEFYKNIAKHFDLSNTTFLSGIVGDVWAGSISNIEIGCVADVIKLAYAHELNLKQEYIRIASDESLLQDYYVANYEKLQNEKFRVVAIIRFKIILLSYLCQVPEYFGMPSWTPFLNFDVVMSFLNLPKHERKNRKWQIDYFDQSGLNIGKLNLASTRENTLNYIVCPRTEVQTLNLAELAKYFDITRLSEINATLSAMHHNNTTYPMAEYLRAVFDYYVIIAFQKGLRHDC